MEEQEAIKEDNQSAVRRYLGGKYLTFILEDEEFGINISDVKEIIKLMEITHVPQTPDYIKGVINLRERVIPVTDLRLKFGMSQASYSEETCIIVLDMADSLRGIIVDSVSEVADIKNEEIEPPPAFDDRTDVTNILGMAKVKGSVKILLDIDKVLRNEVSAVRLEED